MTISNQGAEIEALNKELNSMRKNVEQYNIEHRNRKETVEEPAAAPAKKPRAKKAAAEPKAKAAPKKRASKKTEE